MTDKEYIICAAIWVDDGIWYSHQPNGIGGVGYVVCGRRHHNCFMTISLLKKEDIRTADYGKVTQGFVTSLDRFVNREEAAVIAYLANQIDKPTEVLFSEDLY